MNPVATIKNFLRLKRSVQYLNGYPIFLTTSADGSFDDMKTQLGFSYTRFLFRYKNGYGPGSYLTTDFDKLWRMLSKKIKKQPNYLLKVWQKYKQIYSGYFKIYNKIDHIKPKDLDERQLINFLHETVKAQKDSIGVAHIIEPLSINFDNELRRHLIKKIPDIDKYYGQLTTPSRLSFLAQEEYDLYKINHTPKQLRQKKLQKHYDKYFWIQNSYLGPKNLGLQYFKRRLSSVKFSRPAKSQKLKLIKKFNIDAYSCRLLDAIDLITCWQDERKKNILIAVYYLNWVLREISRRTNVPLGALYYLGRKEALKLDSFAAIQSLKKELMLRGRGAYYLEDGRSELIVFSKDYERLFAYEKKIEIISGPKEIKGFVAQPGKVRGEVSVCEHVSSFARFKTGNILVAFMTRPEYMPVMRKASAIVTDEGGITSHAAIVSRELGIPCIVGTKIASRVLKDGDFVEVNANHGWVRKIMK
jgi:phosphohistidine swiveling domain-containing protein